MTSADCVFCKIIAGEIPSTKIYETDHIYAFMDVNPLAEGHCLFIPKVHAERMHMTSDTSLAEILPAIKEVVKALGIEDYNILQNNGSIAHQAVGHTHFHMIPKPEDNKGLKISWQPIEGADQEKVAKLVDNSL